MENTNSNVARQATVLPLTDKWFEDAHVSSEAKDHLLRSLRSLEKEQAPTPSFKLYGKVDVSVVTDFLDSVPWNRIAVPKGWKEYEYSRLAKFGPQGGHPAWEVIEPLFKLYQERLSPVTYVDKEVMHTIFLKYSDVFRGREIVPEKPSLSLARLLANDKISTRAAGCRCFNMKKTDILAQTTALKDIQTGLYKSFFMYTFERFNKQKPRIFMPGPFSSMIDQAAYCLPKLEIIKQDIEKYNGNSSLYHFADKLGFDKLFLRVMPSKVEEALVRLRDRVGDKFDINKITPLYIQGDFEKMDTTTGQSQYENLYIPICSTAINRNYRGKFHDSMLQTVTMPIASPSGMMVGDHGTGSGMENTNDGESNCNLYYGERTLKLIVIMTQKYMKGLIYEFAGSYYNGDDSAFIVLLYDVSENVVNKFKDIFQHCAERAAHECGFRINDKWRMDTNFGLYNQNGFWFEFRSGKVEAHYIYPASLILNSIVNPEKQYSKSSWDKDYRDIDIIEKLDNGKYLPYFKELVKYVSNGMKYRLLGRSEEETRRILSKYDKYRALQSLSERFNRQDYDISSSATVNLIASWR